MSSTVVNDVTPTRKRKRDSEKLDSNANTCFTNAAFSSTPKIVSGRRCLVPVSNNNTCMEVKSIADLVKKQKECSEPAPFNPYEVQRKKKKKHEKAIEENFCFENPALNLNVPEKKFNPFEVVRNVEDCRDDQQKCFVNEALNIKGQESTLTVRNPFEIDRETVESGKTVKSSAGVDNLALNDAAAPTSLKIGIPFTPTVGCRIDFNNVSLTQLTPSKLLLAEKLVFSPVSALPKRSLDAITEESSSTSIGKELDRYQLELENSINEAKLRKNDVHVGTEKLIEDRVYQLQLKVEKRVSLGQRLTEIPEDEEDEIGENKTYPGEKSKDTKSTIRTIEYEDHLSGAVTVKNVNTMSIETNVKNEVHQKTESTEPELDYISEEDEDDIDFKAPTQAFVRCYRRDVAPKLKISNSKESLSSKTSIKSSSECIAEQKNHKTVKDILRKSIRKIMPHHKSQSETQNSNEILKIDNENKDDEVKQCTLASHIMSSIRHSLRRKPKSTLTRQAENLKDEIPLAETSIIDTSERKMKLKSCATRNDYARIEELTTEKKHLLRNGSLRRSMMKTIFHKQEEYTFQK